MSKYPALNSYLENLSNLKGKAKIDYLCWYIDSQARKQMINKMDSFINQKIVFSELDAKVRLYYDADHPIYSNELWDIIDNLHNMNYEAAYSIDNKYITFWLTK